MLLIIGLVLTVLGWGTTYWFQRKSDEEKAAIPLPIRRLLLTGATAGMYGGPILILAAIIGYLG